MNLSIQPLTDNQIREFISWQYDGSYAMYSMTEDNEEESLSFFSDPANGYFAIVDEDDLLLGFCNFGEDARVPGGTLARPSRAPQRLGIRAAQGHGSHQEVVGRTLVWRRGHTGPFALWYARLAAQGRRP